MDSGLNSFFQLRNALFQACLDAYRTYRIVVPDLGSLAKLNPSYAVFCAYRDFICAQGLLDSLVEYSFHSKIPVSKVLLYE